LSNSEQRPPNAWAEARRPLCGRRAYGAGWPGRQERRAGEPRGGPSGGAYSRRSEEQPAAGAAEVGRATTQIGRTRPIPFSAGSARSAAPRGPCCCGFCCTLRLRATRSIEERRGDRRRLSVLCWRRVDAVRSCSREHAASPAILYLGNKNAGVGVCFRGHLRLPLAEIGGGNAVRSNVPAGETRSFW